MKKNLVVASALALVLGTGFAYSASAMSVYDSNALTSCLRLTHAAFKQDAFCQSYMQNRGISNDEMDLMKTCKAHHIVKTDRCMPLVEKYADIMLAPDGSIISPFATDVNDR
jgi:hypothetical protein